jgi:hypothetical protein
MKLARSTIIYFSRSEYSMDRTQHQQLHLFRRLMVKNDVMNKLVEPRPREYLTDDLLVLYANMLNEIFFFGAAKDFEISWCDGKVDFKTLGDTRSYTEEGR